MEKELLKRIDKLELEILNLKSAALISHETEGAFRDRFRLDRLDDVTAITASAKSASSENQAVNEAGAAAYSVLKPPDEFLDVTVGGSVKHIPVYT
jgi:hypothetical protein